MRHQKRGRKLGRDSAHRKSLYANLTSELIQHGRIRTMLAKAKEVRPVAEQMITLGKRGDLHARRQAVAFLRQKTVVKSLFEDVAPRYAERPGGYTRILRVGFRRGDSAEVAHVELVGSEYNPRTKEEKEADKAASGPKTKSVGDRLRSVARGVRTRGEAGGGAKGQAGGQTKGRAQKSTTPRKAGGS